MPFQGSVTKCKRINDMMIEILEICQIIFNDRRKLNAIINTSELVNVTNVNLPKRGVWVKDNSDIFNKLLFIFSILHK